MSVTMTTTITVSHSTGEGLTESLRRAQRILETCMDASDLEDGIPPEMDIEFPTNTTDVVIRCELPEQ